MERTSDQFVDLMAGDPDWMDSLTREREEATLAALERIREAGANPEDITLLASELDVGKQWRLRA